MSTITATAGLLDRLAAHPVGQRIIEEDRRARSAAHAEAVKALDALEREAPRRLPGLAEKAREAGAAYRRALVALQSLEHAAGAASAEHRREAARIDRERERLRDAARTTAAPVIARTLAAVAGLEVELLGRAVPGAEVGEYEMRLGRNAWAVVTHGASPAQEKAEALAALRAARPALEALVFEALDDAAAGKRVGEVLGALPPTVRAALVLAPAG